MIEIKSYAGAVMHRSEKFTILEAVQEAVAARASLDGANLAGANLARARPILMLGPIGSRGAYLTAYLTDQGIKIQAGCWSGSLADFGARVESVHGTNDHSLEYRAAIAMIETHAAIWMPKEGVDA